MEILEGQNVVKSCVDGGAGDRSVVYKLQAAATFDLEKAVCSHGFFMTAPNHWDPVSKTLQRPLRLLRSLDHENICSSSSFTVQISQPPQSSHLIVRVFETDSLSPAHQQSLMEQVRRMLRMSEEEEKKVEEFQEIYHEAKTSGFGRIFRSPTLFEDMVKCILVCNCQWSRTLSMARALCELQYELQQPTSTTEFAPKTPLGKRKMKSKGPSRNVAKRCATMEADDERVNYVEVEKEKIVEQEFDHKRDSDKTCIGNFPSPQEIASLDVNLLGRRCNLGYRASRILGLAKSVVEGRIQLRQLEQDSLSSNYIKLNEQLGKINGFGPFTRANVLMCLGFYHVIPSDSETIRHLNQVHGKKSTIKNIQQDIEIIYGKYAPFQFLVYWSEIWSFYEERFGKLSEVPSSRYKLITASNMR
ncbi:unnamed protein product [Lactuca saligna]|uniref:HhH-GPD domain-containing protein n=1 Tax=Lactuca saligna TaxID=75948 RepID=A0AA35ZKW1_LACSI|nr:unnamed protein product [Lactuca saligna]